MSEQELRLELVKLTYNHGRDVSEAVGRAKILEEYVLGISPEVPSPRRGRPPKIQESPQKFQIIEGEKSLNVREAQNESV